MHKQHYSLFQHGLVKKGVSSPQAQSSWIFASGYVLVLPAQPYCRAARMNSVAYSLR